MTLKSRIENSINNIKKGKKALADALNGIGISSSPNSNSPNTYETFQSYADKIKKCIPAPSLIFEIEITSSNSAMDRSYVLPMSGINYTTIKNSINSSSANSLSTMSIVDDSAMLLNASIDTEVISSNPEENYKIKDYYGNEMMVEGSEKYINNNLIEDELLRAPTGVPDWDNTLDPEKQMAMYNAEKEIMPLATSDYDFTVDWGDGTSNTFVSLNDEACYHVYKSTGTYQIRITGTFRKMYRSADGINPYPSLNKLTKVISWGNTGLTSMSEAFRNETKLTQIPLLDTTNSFSDVTTFYCCFYGCTGLKEIPYDSKTEKGLFDGCSNATTFSLCFYNCSNMVGTIPPGLFKGCSKVTNFSSVFESCRKLTGGLPVGMFDGNTGITNVSSAFFNCSGLTGTIDPNIFAECPNITTYACTFWNCTGLTGEIPAGVFASSKATDFRNTFKGCTKLTSINKDVFSKTSANNVKLTATFEGCTGLTTLPEGIFDGLTGSGLGLDRTFYGCTGLKTIPGSIFAKITKSVYSACSTFGFCTGLTGLSSGSSITEPTNGGVSQWSTASSIKSWMGCFGNTGSFNQLSKLREELGGTLSRLNTILPGDIVLSNKTVVSPSNYTHTSSTPAIGLVVDYDSSRASGSQIKVMALTDTTRQWTPQSMVEDTPLSNRTSTSISTWNGITSTNTIKNWSGYTTSKYPAHAYVLSYSTTGTSAGDWYLGDWADGWYAFIRKALIENGVKQIKSKFPASNVVNYRDNTWYWTSNEYSVQSAGLVSSNRSGVDASNGKWLSYYVRPCLSI